MLITKNISLKEYKTFLEILEKLKKNPKIKTIDLHGSLRKEERFENYSISWTEEEEIK